VVEGARLESEYTPKAYRGFESLPLRHPVSTVSPLSRNFPENGAKPGGFGLLPYRENFACVEYRGKVSEILQRYHAQYRFGITARPPGQFP
jgi:hypothetical protein